MKHKLFLSSLAALFFIHACTSSQQKQTVEQVTYDMLDSASIYDYNTATKYVATTEAFAYAKKLYLNAIDESVNKKNPEASLPLFLQSLRLQPDPYTYLRYGDALYEVGNYSVALKAYSLSDYFSISEVGAEADYNRARCYAAMNNEENALMFLETALEKFPFEKDKIESEKVFDFIRNTERYKIITTTAFSDEQGRLKKLLTIFAGNFPEGKLPYYIGPDSLTVSDGHSIDYRYNVLVEELGDGEFSREVSSDFQYVASLKLSSEYYSFIYRSVDYMADAKNPIHYTLINVDTTGKVLGEQEIACFCSPLTIKTLNIAADGLIEVKEIVQTWKEDPIYKGYEDNEVVKQEVKDVKYYKALSDGTILEDANAAATASENAQSTGGN